MDSQIPGRDCSGFDPRLAIMDFGVFATDDNLIAFQIDAELIRLKSLNINSIIEATVRIGSTMGRTLCQVRSGIVCDALENG
uniref:Protein kinase domain-containing protein n=1 Tax=Panagrellus redivivus TaxID=6233 RepID=A0A7E4W398_PANRE